MSVDCRVTRIIVGPDELQHLSPKSPCFESSSIPKALSIKFTIPGPRHVLPRGVCERPAWPVLWSVRVLREHDSDVWFCPVPSVIVTTYHAQPSVSRRWPELLATALHTVATV